MKICIISFDYWNYDHHIVKKLQEKGIDASHINMGAYKYKNFGERASNAISKIFLNKNIKHVKRQEYVVNTLKKLGPQDQILVLNPHTLDYQTIKEIKSYTPYLISYLYDNLERFPVEDRLKLFDKIYSFEDKDVKKYGFEKITNYNYLSEQPIQAEEIENDLFYITSYDKRRIKLLRKLTVRLSALEVRSKIIVVGKQVWKEKLRNFILRPVGSALIEFRKKPINNETILEEYKKSKVIIDLMREGQAGLSFRVFEAMALGKKIITDNQSIQTYDFFKPENFLIVNDDLSNIENQFFTLSYQRIPTSLYQKYSLNHWVDHIFGISSTFESKNMISSY
ncbi:hypothetical protein HS960_23705 [Sphingobacterium paramultivorum]|uniref:Spore protein YkvP/CgeB glycosyl transferase-like domain-containing protein n=1 Tax=Sphingobacterium paramultivorum TaxID=2886510 RepID=A0A7G5E901_9SPHI|nr:hypothetical protein [Sphingobacterium paramultivorum]QMV70476.1 hypothetical protein HS960_23705 [Sphingobacterium paramultivorum]WSO14334.1 hypothetical protein VUL84_23715 [Sphingobacterium paramultivorum]